MFFVVFFVLIILRSFFFPKFCRKMQPDFWRISFKWVIFDQEVQGERKHKHRPWLQEPWFLVFQVSPGCLPELCHGLFPETGLIREKNIGVTFSNAFLWANALKLTANSHRPLKLTMVGDDEIFSMVSTMFGRFRDCLRFGRNEKSYCWCFRNPPNHLGCIKPYK